MPEGISAGTAYIAVIPDMAGFSSGVGKGIRKAGKNISSFGASWTRHVTLPIAAAAAVSIKMGLDFDATFQQIVGLAGVSQKSIAGLKDEVLKLAPAVGKSPQELAKALYFIESSGVKGAAALDVLRASAKASASGLGDTETVADALTSAVNAYGHANLSGAKAADILSEAVAQGKGEADAMAGSIGSVLPLAAQMGLKFSDAAGAIAAMTTIGETVPRATTGLQAFMSSLLKTTPRAADALKKVGLSAAGLRDEIAKKGLGATLITLKNAFGDNTKAMAQAFPNIRAMRTVLALTGKNGKNVQKILDQMTHSTGQNGKAFAAAARGPLFKFQTALAGLQVAAIQLSTTLIPIAIDILNHFNALIAMFQGLDPHVQKLITYGALIVAALGPVIYIVGTLVTAIGGLVTIFAAAGSAVLFITGLMPGFSVSMVEGAGAVVTFGEAIDIAIPEVGILAIGIAAIGIAAAGILGYMSSTTSATDGLEGATSAAERAVRGLTDALNKSKVAHHDVEEARHQQTASTLALRDAEKAYHEAVKKSGKGSLDAKKAANALTIAKDNLYDAHNRVIVAQENETAQDKKTKAAEDAHNHAVRRISNTYKGFQKAVTAARLNVQKYGAKAVPALQKAQERLNKATEGARGEYKKLAKVYAQQADAVAKSNPKLAAADRALAKRVTAIGELATKLGRLPTEKEIHVKIIEDTYKATHTGHVTGGHHAHGGPVHPSAAYPVGENGPELFVPNRSGTILPNGASPGGGGWGGGPMTIVLDDGTQLSGYVKRHAKDENSKDLTYAATKNRMSRR